MPPLDVAAEATHDLAHGLVRVLDDDGNAGGDWEPSLSPEEMRQGLRHMLHVRAYDDPTFGSYVREQIEEGVAPEHAVSKRVTALSEGTVQPQLGLTSVISSAASPAF